MLLLKLQSMQDWPLESAGNPSKKAGDSAARMHVVQSDAVSRF